MSYNRRKSLREENYQLVPNILINEIKAKKIRAVDLCVYIILLDHARGKTTCYPSYDTTSGILGVSEKTVERSLNRLVLARHLKRKGKKKRLRTRIVELMTTVDSITRKVVDGRKAANDDPNGIIEADSESPEKRIGPETPGNDVNKADEENGFDPASDDANPTDEPESPESDTDSEDF